MMPYNVRNAGGGSVGGILRRTGHASSSSSNLILSNGNGGTGMGGTVGTAGGSSSSASLNLENHRQTPLELLVFGYACKIFRDDEKAREMDHGKQLIPWMGDVNLKIDRYDVRGALCELAPHEAPPGGYGNRLEYLTAEEQRAEQLCEEERYLFLYNNEEELRLRQEEDLKRLQQETSGGNYSQVGFQYDGQSAASASTAPSQLSPTSEENELPFVLPYTLMMVPPLGMQLPETMKQHAIIEKTARFIATQGAQMEILIKAKQANNNQFDFLTQGGHLQPYYRHLLAAIKAAKFPPAPEATLDQQQQQTGQDQESNPSTNDVHGEDGAGGGRRNSNQVVITVPTIKYKPSANCAYTQLISKIKGVPLQAVLLEDESSNPGNSQHSGTDSPTPSCRSEGHNSQGGGEFTPVLLQYNGSTFTHETETPQDDNENNSREPPQVELLKNTSALALAQNYSSESDDEEEEEPEKEPEKKPEPVLTFPVPEESLRHIIDKTATYVIKNGRQFEETLRTKSVERFSFLLPANEFYAYYLYKVTGDVDAASKEEKTRKAAAVAAALMSKKGLSFGGAAAAALGTGNNLDKAPVSFSIRARDEHGPLQPTLPQETSDEEASSMAGGGGEQVRPGMPDSVQRAIKQVETQLLARTAGQKSSAAPSSCSSPQKEQRQAEERVKDKLAQIAREKLNGMISREKQLQLERKRKAMAFLNQIKGEGATVGSAVTGTAPNPPEAAAGASQSAGGESDNESNDESVRSIPITFFGPDDDDEVGDDDQKEPEVRLERRAKEDEEDDDEEDEDDDGDLEKYNLLNDDSTNTFTSKPAPSLVAPPPPAAASAVPAPAVLLSDDDDVQLVATSSSSRSSRSRPRKMPRRSMSRSRNGRSRSRSASSASSRESSHRRRQKSSKPSKEPSSSIAARKSQSQSTQRRKGSPKKRRRSRSRSRSRSHRRSRSRSSISRTNRRSRSRSYSGGSREAEQRHRQQQQRRRTPTKKSHKRHKRRRRSSSP
ncbi:protein suppressor of white apricot isoform X1 [Drosophila takahashii]|uniref:protein suppressor of white apricot isoform X1 n=2 Tax=Drosophila takahashii TaxID=29030 RepID=UPI001CF8C22A|nr:protein suppressor of white apricot isoform X2 [Drosophila takahashii]